MESIGLFGGSFNPVHLGHLLVAQSAREELQLDQLVFVPAAQSPFKPGTPLAPASHRLRLLRIALAGHPEYQIDDQEIRRGGLSYTIDTLLDYAARFPNRKLFYLIGADHVAQLPLWRESAKLAELARFVVIPRPGQPSCPLPKPFQGTTLHGFPLGVSSSAIRDRIRHGLPVDLLVGPAVAEAILKNRLYL